MKKSFKYAYEKIRTSYLRLEMFKKGDFSDRTQVETTVMAALHSLIPDSEINYKTITANSFWRKFKSDSKRRRSE